MPVYLNTPLTDFWFNQKNINERERERVGGGRGGGVGGEEEGGRGIGGCGGWGRERSSNERKGE